LAVALIVGIFYGFAGDKIIELTQY
jgi:hypothetical protein